MIDESDDQADQLNAEAIRKAVLIVSGDNCVHVRGLETILRYESEDIVWPQNDVLLYRNNDQRRLETSQDC